MVLHRYLGFCLEEMRLCHPTNSRSGGYLKSVVVKKLMELWFDTDEKAAEQFLLERKQKNLDERRAELSEPDHTFMQPFLGKHEKCRTWHFHYIPR